MIFQNAIGGRGCFLTVPFIAAEPPDEGGLTFAMTNHANTTVSALAADEAQVTRTTGTDAWDASAISDALTGDFILRVTPQNNDKGMIVGMASNPTDSDSFDWTGHKIWFHTDGNAKDFDQFDTPYSVGEHWFIKRTGSTITVGNGGTDGVSGFTSRGTYTLAGTIYLDSSLYGGGASFITKRLA